MKRKKIKKILLTIAIAIFIVMVSVLFSVFIVKHLKY